MTGSGDGGSESERHRLGVATRRGVLGDAHVERASAAATRFDATVQTFITEGAWGSVWSRPGPSRRERSLITLALLAAGGHDEEVAMHCRESRNTGASPEDMLHVAGYAGVPAANHAIKIAKTTLAAMEAEDAKGAGAAKQGTPNGA